MKEYTIGKKNKVRQLREKAHYDEQTVHAILDAGLVAHVALVQDGEPVVVPMIYGRDGDTLYLHGARKARVIRLLEKSGRACINVTLVDGLVFARSTFNSSMNYRSVTGFGRARLIDDVEDKKLALRTISDCIMPGRRAELRPDLYGEIVVLAKLRLKPTRAKPGPLPAQLRDTGFWTLDTGLRGVILVSCVRFQRSE